MTAGARDVLVASLAVSYPDAELAAVLAPEPGAAPLPPALAPLAAAVRAGLEPVQRRYGELFDRGASRVSLHETEHGRMRGLAKGRDLADLAGFYRAFGLTPDEDGHELLDHLAVELEFYGMLLVKQEVLAAAGDAGGGAIVAAARGAFLADHLGRFAGTIAAHPAVAADPVYGPALAWCAALVAAECAALGVAPAPLDLHAGPGEPERVECGGAVHLPVVD